MAIYEITAPNGQVLEIEGDTPPTEADLDEIFKSTKTAKEPTRPRSKGLFSKMSNDDVKAYYQNELDKRKEWEQNHPVLSDLQKNFTPYRAQQKEMELRAKYGYNAPIGESLKSTASQFAQNLIPAANITTALGTGGMLNGAKGLLPLIGRGAAQGAIQGGVLAGSNELGDNGLSLNVIPETLKGTAAGATVGGVLPPVLTGGGKLLGASGNLIKRGVGKLAQISPETVEQVIKPTSKALDYTREKAQDVLRSTTERVRNAYNNLLGQKGEAIQAAEENLRNIPERVNVDDVLGDIRGTFDQYQGEAINPARNMAGNVEEGLNELVGSGADELNTISPIDLQKIKQQVGQMTNWADTTRPKIQNTVLEQVYGKMRNRLEDISPELAQANKEYAALKGFQEDEGLKTILAPGGAIDRASTTLKNYNSTVSKGNTARNIQALEDVLTEQGEAPFLSTMDDINAATDLLKQEKTGLGSIAELGKSLITRPALKLARAYNRSPLPQTFGNIRNIFQRAAIPFIYRSPQRLETGINYEDEY